MSTRTVIFDMDGTLVQSRAAAWEVFQDTNARFELGMASPDQFFDLFRENFFAALRDFVGEPAKADQVADHFFVALRERYTPELIPGMTDIVQALAGHFSLAVISSNAMGAIRRTLEGSGVAHCFAHVFSGDVEPDKKAAIHRILADPSYTTIRRCSPAYAEDLPAEHERPTAEEIVLITDTVGDVREARMCGIRVIGVAWGMHPADELAQAGAEFVAMWPQEIVARLLPEGSCRPGGCECLTCVLPEPAGAQPSATRAVGAEARQAGELRSRRRRERAPALSPGPAPTGPARPSAAAPDGCGGPCCRPGGPHGSRPDPDLAVALSIIAAAPVRPDLVAS